MGSTNQKKKNIYPEDLEYFVQAITDENIYLEHNIFAIHNAKAIYLFCQLYPHANIKTIKCRLVKKSMKGQVRMDL